MRISDQIRDCVGFIQAEWPSGASEIGTAFFMGVPLGVDGHWFNYAVTARHCVSGRLETQRKEDGSAAKTVLFVNQLRGGRIRFIIPASDWLLHDTADVAILPLGSINPLLDVVTWDAVDSVANEEVVKKKDIGAGDDIFITGLLVHHPGATRNIPIVRLGSVAALANDAIALETGTDVVTLVEVHSIGGLSGPPVFIHLSLLRDSEKGKVLMGTGGKAQSGGTALLHGVMHGFYPVGLNDPDHVSQGDENLNTGIAVVVRIDRVLELINSSDQVRIREEIKGRILAQMVTPATSGARSANVDQLDTFATGLFRVPGVIPEQDQNI
jgi:hypothetical protein